MGCVFCKVGSRELDALVVYEDNHIIAFMDKDPINEGHVLITPKEHFLDADDMPKELLLHIMSISQNIIKSIKKVYSPHGYTIMQNGGIFNDVGHFHLHIFPRYKEDGFGWRLSDEMHDISEYIAKQIANNM